MIDILHERIKIIFVDNITQYPLGIELRFKTIINRRFNLRELKAVAVKFLHSKANYNKKTFVNLLYLYFSSHIYLPEQNNQLPWLDIRGFSQTSDQIPYFARDLEETLNSNDNDSQFTWYIDRTPSPISVAHFRSLQQQDESRLLRFDQGLQSYDFALDMPVTNLLNEFNASYNISQIKKYDIYPILLSEELEECIEECPICYESIRCNEIVKLNCDHKFCGNCIKGSLKAHNNIYIGPSCALCRKEIENFIVKNKDIYNSVSEHCNL